MISASRFFDLSHIKIRSYLWVFTSVVILVMQLFTCSAIHAQTTAVEDLPQWDESRVQQYYKSIRQFYTNGYTRIGDHFFLNSKYNRRFRSSAQINGFSWKKEKTKEMTESGETRGEGTAVMTQTTKIEPPDAEVFAISEALPKVEEEAWGMIYEIKLGREIQIGEEKYRIARNLKRMDGEDYTERYKKRLKYWSGVADRMRRENEERTTKDVSKQINEVMEFEFAEQLKLLDQQKADSNMAVMMIGFDRVTGSSGEKHSFGSRYNRGERVVLVRSGYLQAYINAKMKDRTGSRRQRGDVYIMIPESHIRQRIKPEDFDDLLEKAGLTPTDFVNQVRVLQANHGGTRHDLIRSEVQDFIENAMKDKAEADMKADTEVVEEEAVERIALDELGPIFGDSDNTTSDSTSNNERDTSSDTRDTSNSNSREPIKESNHNLPVLPELEKKDADDVPSYDY